jgi:hypothetical protein
MNRRNRIQLALGMLLIILGIGFFADRQFPEIHEVFARFSVWPANLVGIGALVLVIGLFMGVRYGITGNDHCRHRHFFYTKDHVMHPGLTCGH